jgi:DNA-binding NarL/FixJ family response regulator
MKSMNRVPLVEDQGPFAESLRAALVEHAGAKDVCIAATLAHATEALQTFRPDLVLLDLGLPDGNGLSLLDQVATLKERPTVIVLTIFDDDEHLFGALRKGADGYILKEESGVELAKLLHEILEGRPPLSGSIAERILRCLRGARAASQPALTEREEQVVRLLAAGHTVESTARQLEISAHTVQHHVKNTYRKLNVHSRAELTRAAVGLGMA